MRQYLDAPEDGNVRENLVTWLSKVQIAYNYDMVFLVDTQGTVRLAASNSPEFVCNYLLEQMSAVLESGQVRFVDFHRDGPGGSIHLSVLVPIREPVPDGNPLGVLVLRIDPKTYLYPFINNWPVQSDTAETLIVRRDGSDALFLNELRFNKNAALNLRIPLDRTDTPAVAAVLGHEGLMEGVDYRGVPVVAVTRSVPDSPWFLIARMDRAEIYAPIRQRLWLVIVLVTVLLFGAMAGLGLVWRQQRARFYRERYEAAEALRESEARFRAIFEQAAVGIAQVSLDGHWIQINEKFCNIVGYPREELLTLTFQDITHPDDLNADLAYVAQVLDGEINTYSLEKRYIRKDHTEVWINLTVGLVRDDANGPKYFIRIVEDITERKQSEIILFTRLRLAKLYDEATLDELIQAGLDAAELLTGSTIGFFHFVDADQENLTLQTWPTNTLKNMCTAEGKGQHYPINQAGVWVDCIRDRAPVIHNDYASLPHKKGLPPGHAPVTRELVVPILRNDAVVAVMGVGNKPADYTEDDVRLVQELLVYIVDTVERKRVEVAIKESEVRYHNLFNSLLEGFCIIEVLFDAEGLPVDYRFLEVNPAFAALTGLHDAKGKRIRELVPDNEAHWYETYGKVALTGESVRFVNEVKALNRWYDVSAYKVGGQDSRKVAILFNDITKRKQAEEALRSISDRQEALLAALPDIVMEVDQNKVYTWVNQPGIEFFGEDVIGKGAADYFEGELDVYEVVQPLFNGDDETIYLESWQRRKDGEKRLLAWWCKVLKDSSGNVTGALSSARDITDRKRAEDRLRAVLADLERSNKELEQFAYVASHDLQEPLRMVASYTQMLARHYEGQMDEKAKKYMDYAVDGAVRMQNLINDLLAYSRVGTRGAAFKLVDSHAALGLALVNLQGAIQESGAIVTNDNLPKVYGDETQLAQLFQNLIGNAIKFRGAETPHVHISVTVKGKTAEFCVRDNSIGIDPKHAERVFQLFQRLHTRAEYPGTGIGLALCKRIVERHGGKIWFESEPGKGAYFYFTISTK